MAYSDTYEMISKLFALKEEKKNIISYYLRTPESFDYDTIACARYNTPLYTKIAAIDSTIKTLTENINTAMVTYIKECTGCTDEAANEFIEYVEMDIQNTGDFGDDFIPTDYIDGYEEIVRKVEDLMKQFKLLIGRCDNDRGD